MTRLRLPKLPFKGGMGHSRTSHKRYRKRLLEYANFAYGGAWVVAEHTPGRLVLLDRSQMVSVSEVHKNAHEMCSLRRYAHMSGAVTRDIAYGRRVPWTCVGVAWKWLQGPHKPLSINAQGFNVAFLNLEGRFKHVMECMESGWQDSSWPREGELWVRWGVDGVPRWSSHYVTMTLAFCGKHGDFKVHSVERFASWRPHAAIQSHPGKWTIKHTGRQTALSLL